MNAQEVFNKMAVCADGGLRRGCYYGTGAVGFGRSVMFVNIWRVDEVSKIIQTLKAELKTTIQLLCENHASRINSSCVGCRLMHSRHLMPMMCLGQHKNGRSSTHSLAFL